MLVADSHLVSRLECLVVAEVERFALLARELYPDTRARALHVGGGVALFGGEEIPFNEVTGLGVNGPVGAAELDLIEAFYDDFRAPAQILVTSLGDPLLMSTLARRGWLPTGYEDVLVLELDGPRVADPIVPDFDIRVVKSDEREQWGRCVATGFSDSGRPTDRELRFGRIVAAREGATLLWAWVDGQAVATAELMVEDEVAWFSADTTLPEYRERGIQRALQRARIEAARDAGCEIAVTEAAPGGSSHRNMQRLGFRVGYTHLIMQRDASP